MRTNFFLLFAIVSFFACGPKLETIEVKNEAGIVTERYTQDPKTELREGKSALYFENGKVQEESNYTNGILAGERKLYYDNGKLQAIERYEKGTFAGIYQAFYENDTLELEGQYIDGVMNGKWKRYYETGKIMEVVMFKDNEENGPFIEYYENGKTKAEGTYMNGDNEHGELKMYDETGELERTMNCLMGRCETVWQKEEKKI